MQLVEVSVNLSRLPHTANGLRIGLLSDFHCDSERMLSKARHAVSRLLDQRIDVVCLTGDYITVRRSWRYLKPLVTVLRPLASAPLGAYAVLGNHDWWSGCQDYVSTLLSRAGIRAMRNDAVELDGHRGLFVVGLDDPYARRADVAKALAGVPSEACKVMLVHEPDFADHLGDHFDLQLSGHSHGGQIRIAGLPILHYPPHGRKYTEGLRQSRTHLVYTTRGVGAAGIPIRLWCPAEITVLTLNAVDEARLPPGTTAIDETRQGMS